MIPGEPNDETYYVATLARYVLVDAENEARARRLGLRALRDLYAGARERTGAEPPIEIRTVREATTEDIELSIWHHELEAENER